MILASAQTKPKRGDLTANLEEHYRLIDLASQQGADLIVFPEMSITGYEREKAEDLAFRLNDSRLNRLRELSVDRNIVIIVGAPIKDENNLFIGTFILKPDNSIFIYTKQFLHEGEKEYFKSSFKYNPMIELKNEKISLAICADIDNSKHAENAGNVGTTLYIAGIFFSPNGIGNAYEILSGYAKKYSMNILMSNFGGQSWGIDSGGQSGFWNKNGKLIANLNNSDSGLLLIERDNDVWTEKKLK